MSETESEYSDTEADDQSISTNTNNPVIKITKEDGELYEDDEDEDEDEEAEGLYKKPPITIGEEMDNLSENDSESSEDYDIEKEYDYDLGANEPYNPLTTELESSSEEEDEVDEDYLKRFDNEVITNHMKQYHPESSSHNYEEVKMLSVVSKDKEGHINDVNHRTLPFLTKFEKSKILGIRAKQIDDGAEPFVKVMPNIITGYTIAQMELIQKKIPFIIRRPLPNGTSEYWKVSDLELIE